MAAPHITEKSLRSYPKVLLHDHLDGGLRSETIISLAREINYRSLPSYDERDLENWMLATADQGKLELYLEAFAHTIAVMQTEESLFRVAEECVEDLAEDGIVYAEVRFAPELFQQNGLSLNQVVSSVLQGFESGSDGKKILVKGILCAMRSNTRSVEVVEVAAAFADHGIVGFDIAGPEVDFPPRLHKEAFNLAHKNNIAITIHAGEAAGPEYIEEALRTCHAARIGHGISIQDDISRKDSRMELGEIASLLVKNNIPLEICPTSNIHTGIIDVMNDHPLNTLINAGFLVTINTDNRLMSSTCLTNELLQCSDAFAWDWEDIGNVTKNAIYHSFLPQSDKDKLLMKLKAWEEANEICHQGMQ